MKPSQNRRNNLLTQLRAELYFLFKYYFTQLYYILFGRFFVKVNNVPKKSALTIYIEQKNMDFKGKWATIPDANINIDLFVYDNKQLETVLSDCDNELEKKWGMRSLYEATPVGNIVMQYNIFKQSFEYYTDTKSVMYPVLNAVCMKFCYMYRCRDFFMDENVLDKPSPLVNMNKVRPIRKGGDNEQEFMGYGGKSLPNMAINRRLDRMEKEQRETNRFVYMGKICEFKPFQFVKKEPVEDKKQRELTFGDYKKVVLEQQKKLQEQQQQKQIIQRIPSLEDFDISPIFKNMDDKNKPENLRKLLDDMYVSSNNDTDSDDYTNIA